LNKSGSQQNFSTATVHFQGDLVQKNIIFLLWNLLQKIIERRDKLITGDLLQKLTHFDNQNLRTNTFWIVCNVEMICGTFVVQT
jgi:hypothetical protein